MVERELRQRFVNDDARHAPQRAKSEALREALLKAEDLEARQQLLTEQNPETGEVNQTEWQLGPRPKEETTDGDLDLPDLPGPLGPLGPGAKILSSPRGDGANDPAEEHQFYLEDLHPELQKVLTAQLTQPGAVSAVIEMPQAFLLYLATEKTATILSVESVTVPKADYSEWVNTAKIP